MHFIKVLANYIENMTLTYRFVTIQNKKIVTYFVLSYVSTFTSQLTCTYNRTDLCYAYTKRTIYP